MFVEGKGDTAPSPVETEMTLTDFIYVREVAQLHAEKYKKRTDRWGKGLISEGRMLRIPDGSPVTGYILPYFSGKLGELCLVRYLNRRLGADTALFDARNLSGGDDGVDVPAAGMSIQVKTRTTPSGQDLVRRISRDRKIVSMRSSIYVFAEWTGGASVRLLGWLSRGELTRLPLQKSRVADHRNLVAYDKNLNPMSRLASRIESNLLEGSQTWH